jgi:hypothetical protein
MDAAALSAVAPSPFNSGRRITELPEASVETSMARMVCDLDGGMTMAPVGVEGFTIHFIFRVFSFLF